MAMFAPKPPNDRPVQVKTEPTPPDALSVIASGMRVVGDIETTGIVKIEGRVEGTIRGARQLLLGRLGEIHGDVHAREVVIAGTVVGSIVASERTEVQGTSRVQGDINTKTIVVLEGALVNGNIKMASGAEQSAASSAQGGGDTTTAAARGQPSGAGGAPIARVS